MVSCPDCRLVLQTLDLPCPVCLPTAEPIEADAWLLHEYSKSFSARHGSRTHTDRFVEGLNAWLAVQPGLLQVTPSIDFDHGGVVRGATFTCLASSRPVAHGFRLYRLGTRRKLIGTRPFDVGCGLNAWSDAHPDQTRVWHQVLRCDGTPVECWLLAMGLPVPTGDVPGPASAEVDLDRRRRTG